MSPTIILTGTAGFIGSCMLQYLNENGIQSVYIVDDFNADAKKKNWQSKQFLQYIQRDELATALQQEKIKPDAIIHLGARTDTTEFDYSIHEKLNVQYSIMLWNYCSAHHIPFIYASSAATYGSGELGYNDDSDVIFKLQPLNPYGVSKNEFDKWAVTQSASPISWAGLKFFNVYGPNEYHKGRMASVIWHSFNQINETGKVKLFKSHRPDYKDGQQLRDFIYVKDVVKVIYFMLQKMLSKQWQPTQNNLYNLGTGKARSFEDLVKSTFHAMHLEPNIEFIDMPEDIRDKYQYFTEANMKKLHDIGYTSSFHSLEDGINDYVSQYLLKQVAIY